MKRKVFVYGIVMVLAATSILTDLTISYGCGKTETVDFEDSIEVDTEIYNDNSKNVEDEAGIFNDGSLENGSLFGDLNDLSVINADDDIVTPTGVSLPETISVKKYEVCTVTPILDPINATTTFSWYSSNSDIVEVSSADLGYSGNITGVSEGQATVTVTTNNGYSASMLVSVNEIVEPMDFTMDNELKITKDENKYIDTYVIPKNAITLYKVTSDNPSVVSTFTGGGGLLITRNGQSQYYASSVGISGICAGTANITVETVNGIKKNCTVIVEEGESPETISIPESYEIKEGKDWDIPITISPASAKTTYRIDTENSKIARVSETGACSGCRVYGVVSGVTTITVYTANGLFAKCKILVVHDWENNKRIDIEPTCINGKKSIHCKVCNATKDSEVLSPVMEHSWGGEYVIDEEAGCTKAGSESFHCIRCNSINEKSRKEIPATGHSWDAGKITKEATCEEAGVKTYTCTSCKTTKTEAIKALGHKEVKDEAVAATCEKDGLTEGSHCSVCNKVLTEQKKVPATGHSWDAGKITKEATCEEAGVKTYTCTSCKTTKTEAIKALGHKEVKDEAVAATCEKDGLTEGSHCSACNKVLTEQKKVPATGHKFSPWKTTSQATVFSPEQQSRSCRVCGKSENREIGNKLQRTMTVTATSLTLKTKQKTNVLKVSGLAAGDSIVSWKSNNTKVVKVSGRANGTSTITAGNKKGTAKITITLKSGLQKTVTVTVQKTDVKTKKITGVAKNLKLKRKQKAVLRPVITPLTSVEKVTYISSNTKVATVNSKGQITAKKKGTAVITVKSGSKTVKCKVTVK